MRFFLKETHYSSFEKRDSRTGQYKYFREGVLAVFMIKVNVKVVIDYGYLNLPFCLLVVRHYR